jgi:hypothetical protein
MTHRAHTVLTLALLVLLGMAVYRIQRLQDERNDLTAVRNALIELNHDKSEYIDAGCNGEYQGSEETTGQNDFDGTKESR